jgi:carbamoyl-phosphate synthase small subunit
MREACNSEEAPSAERGWLDSLRDCGVQGITGIDTRALVTHIRDAGAMRGGVFPADISEADARALIESEPAMAGQDLAGLVSPSAVTHHGDGSGPRIAVIDTGIKASMVRELVARGARVSLHPCTSSPAELLAGDPDAIFLSNGPGDPAALSHVVATVREIVGRKPVWGICLGHQLLCRAVGLDTFKLPFGHRGANHPVKDLQTGRVEITSQNHGFAALAPDRSPTIDVDEPVRWETDFGAAQLSHVNLYDRTVEGLELLDVPGGTVQYHPEAGPGPHDSLYLFDRFLERIAAA